MFERAQQLVDVAAPFELHGWRASAPTQRWAPTVRSTDADHTSAADVLPQSHREARRDAAISYLDECFSAIAEGEPGQSYADTPIGSYLPRRYEQYYDGRFAGVIRRSTALRR